MAPNIRAPLFVLAILTISSTYRQGRRLTPFVNNETNKEPHARVQAKPIRKLELVHIPKTGGSAIEYVASLANVTWGLCHWKERLRAGPGCHVPDWKDYDAAEDMKSRDVGPSFELWHTPPSWLTIDSPYQNKSLFAVVRNPYERFVSEFYCPYMGLNPTNGNDDDPMAPPEKHHDVEPKPETPEALNHFLIKRLRRRVKWTAHYVPQAHFVYDESGKQVVDHVLRHERLSADFANLMAQYELPVYLNTTVNQRHNTGNKRMTVADLDPKTIQLINKVADPDFDAFGYDRIDVSALREQRERETTLRRIYYVNLEKNKEQREKMESWLQKQSIPYERINTTVGRDVPEDCVESKRHPDGRCHEIAGLTQTQLDIIRNHNTSNGLTLVLEDDFVPAQPLGEAVQRALRLVPAGWDIIRFDCEGGPPISFDSIVQNEVFRTAHVRECNTSPELCDFYGGTRAMLWRDSSVSKLEAIWSKVPYDSIDLRLTTNDINSYCVNIEMGGPRPPSGDIPNIPKPPEK